MCNNLNDNHKRILDLLYAMSEPICKEKNIRLGISFPAEGKLNACVYYDHSCSSYQIQIFSDCLHLFYPIETMTDRFTKDDLLFFDKVKKLMIFEHSCNDTYREELNNLFSSIILLHIFFHECGHIIAGHVDKSQSLLYEYDASRKGSFAVQEHEMVADWWSTKQLFNLMFHAVNLFNEDNDEKLRILKKITILYWLSLTLEFQIFDNKHPNHPSDLSSLTHPIPAVRLYYTIEATREGISDVLLQSGLSLENADKGADIIVNAVLDTINSFLGIMNVPIDFKKFDRDVVECYMKLRDIPYEIPRDAQYLHLAPLPDGYRESIEECYRIINEQE